MSTKSKPRPSAVFVDESVAESVEVTLNIPHGRDVKPIAEEPLVFWATPKQTIGAYGSLGVTLNAEASHPAYLIPIVELAAPAWTAGLVLHTVTGWNQPGPLRAYLSNLRGGTVYLDNLPWLVQVRFATAAQPNINVEIREV